MSDHPEKADKGPLAQIEITDLLGLRYPLTELVRAVIRGIGNVFEPWQRRRTAKADIDVFEMWKRQLVEVEQLPSSIEISLNERAAIRYRAEQSRQQANRERVAIAAVEEARHAAAEGAPAVERGGRIEDEWIDRFWRLAQDVSDEDLQQLWGRILCRKAQRPGSFSPSTLEALSLLTRGDAREIERLARFTCSTEVPIGAGSAVLALNPSVSGKVKRFSKREPDMELIRAKIQDIERDVRVEYFSPLGLIRDSGWAVELPAQLDEVSTRLRIGSAGFILRGFTFEESARSRSDAPTIYIGSGLGWTRIGCEILSLVQAEPDPRYVELLREGYALLGLELVAADQATS